MTLTDTHKQAAKDENHQTNAYDHMDDDDMSNTHADNPASIHPEELPEILGRSFRMQ